MLNCPNCGAVITGPRCEYCGTKFYTDLPHDYVSKVEYIKRQQAIAELAAAKTEGLMNAKEIKGLYEEALKAMRKYSGNFKSSI